MTSASYHMAGNGPPVVLIHGSMNSKGQWRQLADGLKDHYTVIATDLTGYGQTPFPENPAAHDLLDEVNLIRETLSAVTGKKNPAAHLVAHSYGGAVALCYACHYPDEVLSLNLFEPMANHLLLTFDQHRCFIEGRGLIDAIAGKVARGETRQAARAFIEYFSGQGVFDMLPEKSQRTLAVYVNKMLIDYRTTIDTPLTIDDYRHIGCPICLVTGTHSNHVTLAVSRILRQQLPAVRWIEVPGNHMAPIADPLTVNPVVVDWLADVTGA